MLRIIIFVALVVVISAAAQARDTNHQLVAACMRLDNGTTPKCTCMAGKFGQHLNRKENTYAMAMLTLDENLLKPYKGSFDDKTTDAVKAKIIPLMMDCLL